jgi:prepilin-type N-terminal cleavage/methylation domain-containing protein
MRARSDAGYTLIELIVAVAVLGILTAQLFVVFNTQRKVFVNNERVLDVQEDARLVMDLLVNETRMAGYMVPQVAGISSRDGGTGAPDALCVSDPSALDDAVVRSANDRFRRARIATFVAGGATITLTTAAELNVDADTGATIDFEEGQGIVIADGNRSHCATITDVDVAAGQITFDPVIADPSLFNVGNSRAAPAVIYEIDGSGLTRNGMLMSAEVEDLQVEYGVDVDANDFMDPNAPSEWPLDDLDAVPSARIRAVRLTVVTRTSQNDPEYNGPGLPASANRTAGAPDGFRRRRFVASVLPRNLL